MVTDIMNEGKTKISMPNESQRRNSCNIGKLSGVFVNSLSPQ